MRFAFEILWMRNGSLEPLFHPAPVNLASIETARDLATRFASYAPVHSITIGAEDGSIFECWCWSDGEWGQLELSALTLSPARPALSARIVVPDIDGG